MLPQPDFFQGLTAVESLVAVDLDADGLKDLILPHSRNEPSLGANFRTGRYMQVLMNRGGGRFVAETASRMGDQSATVPEQSAFYGQPLSNATRGRVSAVDVNGDGFPDLVMTSPFFISSEAPLVYLNEPGSERYRLLLGGHGQRGRKRGDHRYRGHGKRLPTCGPIDLPDEPDDRRVHQPSQRERHHAD